MHSSKFKLMLAGAVLLGAAPQAMAANFVTTTTQAGALALIGPGAVQQTFESAANTTGNSVTLGDVTFTAEAGKSLYINNGLSGGYNTIGNSLQNTYASDAFGLLTIDFATSVSAAGFFFGASDTTWTLRAYDATNGLLGMLNIIATGNSNAGNFFGISAAGITRMTVTGPSGDYIALDNLTYLRETSVPGVPEPASWAMLIAGMGVVGAMMRRGATRVSFA